MVVSVVERWSLCSLLRGTDRAALAVVQIGEYPLVEQAKHIPLGRPFGFEIPEEEASSLLEVSVYLGLDIASRVLNERVVPCLKKVDIAAISSCGAFAGVMVTFPARAKAIPV